MDYEAEHNLPPGSASTIQPNRSARRPDLTSFYASLAEVEVPPDAPEAVAPLPGNVAAAADIYGQSLRQTLEDVEREARTGEATGREDFHDFTELLRRMVDMINRMVEEPPKRVEGVSEEFLDGLERIPKKALKKDEKCPICGEKFLDDEHPLVVVLPCHDSHRFDYECIRPWLKLNPTCPLDRRDLIKKKPVKKADDDEEDPDDYFA